MAQNYTRQSTFSDGDTITASLFNDEYDQLLNAFSYSTSSASSTGHRHDGSAGQGGNIHTIGDLDFFNKIVVDSTNNRWGVYVEVGGAAVEQVRIQDGAIVPVTDNDIDLGTSSLEFKDLYLDGTATVDALVADTADINGGTIDGATVGASSASTGAFTTLDASGAVTLSSTLSVQGNTTLGNAAADTVTFTADVASNIIPSADSTHDLGDSSNYWANAYIDAITTTGNVDVGGNLTVTGTTTFNGGTLTLGDAASDNVVFGADVNSSIIPNTDDTYDLGAATQQWQDLYIDGTAYVDAINFNGTAITSTAAELNILDGVTSTAAELNILDGVTSTAAELNVLDGITAVVGELNALDLGSTAVGTAIASKAVILDSNKDYTGIRNLTLAGDLTISGDDLIMGTNTAGHILVADGTNFNPVAVTDLSEISTAADDDVLLAVDTSGGGLKKIARSTIIAGTGSSGDLSNVVEDTTPQLGGDLDVNGNNVVSTSNGNIALTPNGTGVVRIDGNVDIQTGEIVLKNGGSVSNVKFYCEASNAHYTQLQSAAHSAYSGNVTLTLPAATDTLVGRATTDTLTNKTLTSPKINEDVVVSATATELNLLDGVTATTSELNILDGVTSTATELNILDGVTSTTAELNILDGVTSTASELNLVDGSSAGTIVNSKAVVYGASGEVNATTLQIAGTSVTSTAAELNILDGVTSTAAELNILDGVTSTAAELNILDGVTSTTAELNYSDGVTSNIQTQLNAKAGTSNPTLAGLTLSAELTGADQTVSAINLKDYGEITNAIGNATGAKTIDLTAGNSVTATTTGATTWTFSNPTASDELCSFSLKLVNGGSAAQTWPTSVDWPSATAPTLTASGTDVLVFITCDGGTTWYGFVAGLALA